MYVGLALLSTGQYEKRAHQQLALCRASTLFAHYALLHRFAAEFPSVASPTVTPATEGLRVYLSPQQQLIACFASACRTAGRMVSAGGLRAMFLRARIALEVTVHQALATNSNDLAKIFWLAYRQPLCSVISITGTSWAQACTPLVQT